MTPVQFIRNLIDFGPAVFLPLIMLIIGLTVKLKPGRAVSAALTLGVAFMGMSTIIGFMGNAIGPAGQAMVKRTGLQLVALDLGWTPTAAIAWAWPYAALMFLLQIAINLVMLSFRWTECLNVDMWNVWHKAFIGAVMMIITGSPLLAGIMCSLWVVLELRSADLTKHQVHRLTKIPGVAVPHNNLLEIIWMVPVNKLLDQIPAIRNFKATPEVIREKIGFFGESHVLGFLVGTLLGVAAGYNARATLTLGVQAATALVLFPMVASLFMQALAPISEAAGTFMKSRFPGRNFYIGLDWPILAGHPTLWTAAILNIPVLLLCTVFLPGNAVLPFGSIMMISVTMGATVLTQGDLLRTWLLTAIATPFYFYMAKFFAPMITTLAQTTAAFTMPAGVEQITWLAHNGVTIRWVLIKSIEMVTGKIWPGVLALPVFVLAYVFYVREMKRREIQALENG